MSGDFHVYGMLWEPDGYTGYIDGKQDGPKVGYATGDPVSHVPEFILISTEAKWYRNDRMTGKGVPELTLVNRLKMAAKSGGGPAEGLEFARAGKEAKL